MRKYYVNEVCKTCARLAGLLASFTVVVTRVLSTPPGSGCLPLGVCLPLTFEDTPGAGVYPWGCVYPLPHILKTAPGYALPAPAPAGSTESLL